MHDLAKSEEKQVIELNGEIFDLLEPLGVGATGSVLKARQQRLDRIVALKMIHSSVSESQSAVERLRLEAKALAKMQHPNIVKIYSLMMSEKRRPFLVLEFVDGVNLKEFLKQRGTLSSDDFYQIFSQVLSALNAAHQAGLIHRDLKPSNIMVGADLSVKVMDFGIAKALNDETTDPQLATKSGSLIGTPQYMSPEQCKAGPIDFRADLYSVACCMCEALTGNLLFNGDTALETLFLQLHEPANLQKLDARFRRLVSPALEKNPEDRYQSAIEFQHALDACFNKKSELSRATGGYLNRRAGVFEKRRRIAFSIIGAAVGAFILCSFWTIKYESPKGRDVQTAYRNLENARAQNHKYREDREARRFRGPRETCAQSRVVADRYKEALLAYEQCAVADDRNLANDYFNLSTLEGEFDKTRAEQSLRRAVGYSNSNSSRRVFFWNALAEVEFQLGRNSEGVAAYGESRDIALKMSKSDRRNYRLVADIDYALALQKYAQGQPTECWQLLDRSERMLGSSGPDNLKPSIYNLDLARANCLSALGKQREAEDICDRNLLDLERDYQRMFQHGDAIALSSTVYLIDQFLRDKMQYAYAAGNWQMEEKLFRQRMANWRTRQADSFIDQYRVLVEHATNISTARPAEAVSFYREALKLAETGHYMADSDIATFRKNLGELEKVPPSAMAHELKSLPDAMQAAIAI